jgi:hypothetical protein
MGQLEYDHFGLPKSRGGNFLMRSKAGLYVNNCIPLCRTCNSSKGNRDFRAFFTVEEIEEILKRSLSINKYVNQYMVDFYDPDFPNRLFSSSRQKHNYIWHSVNSPKDVNDV